MAESIVTAFGKFKHEHDRRSGKILVSAVREDTVAVKHADKQSSKQDSIRPETARQEPEKRKKRKKAQPVVAEAAQPEVVATQEQPKSGVDADADALTFKVQFFTSPTKLKKHSPKLKGIENADFYKEQSAYKYTTAESTDYNQVVNSFRQILKSFPDAFIVAFKGEQKVPLQDAIKQWKKRR